MRVASSKCIDVQNEKIYFILAKRRGGGTKEAGELQNWRGEGEDGCGCMCLILKIEYRTCRTTSWKERNTRGISHVVWYLKRPKRETHSAGNAADPKCSRICSVFDLVVLRADFATSCSSIRLIELRTRATRQGVGDEYRLRRYVGFSSWFMIRSRR